MRSFLEYFILFIIFASVFFLGALYIVGPLSARNLIVVVVFIVSLFYKPVYRLSRSVIIYFVWLTFYVLVNIISGFLFQENVLKELVSFHVVCVMILFSIPRLVRSRDRIERICVVLMILYFFNAVITILQFHNNLIAWAIGQAITPLSDAAEASYTRFEAEGFLGVAVVTGLIGFVVMNGYFSAVFFPVVTLGFFRNSLFKKTIAIVLSVISIYSVFCIQQRMAFYLVCAYCVIMIWFFGGRRWRLFSLFICLIAIIMILRTDVMQLSDTFGRLLGNSGDNVRGGTDDYVSRFLSSTQNLLFGRNTVGTYEDEQIFLTMGHNSILDSLRRGGIISFLLYLWLLLVLLIDCYKSIRKAIRCKDNVSIVFGASSIIYLLYSMGHSNGIPSGAVYLWISYSVMKAGMSLHNASHRG